MFTFASDGKAYIKFILSYNRSMFTFAVIFIYFVRCAITLWMSLSM